MKSLLTKIIVTSSILATSVPSCALATTVVNLKSNDEPVIPERLLDISNGILYGFAEGTTIADIKEAGYQILRIPAKVTKIANLAFALNFTLDETKLTTLEFEPNNKLEEIGAGAFKRCHSIETVIGLEYCTKLTKIGSEAFSSSGITNKTEDTKDPDNGRLKLPQNLKVIESQAFSRINIRKIQIPESVETVGARAFYAVPSLMDIDFSNFKNIPDWMYKPGQNIFWSDETAATEKGIVTINLNDNTIEDWEEVIWNRLAINDKTFTIEYGGAYPDSPGNTCFQIELLGKEGEQKVATVTRFDPRGEHSLLKIPSTYKPDPTKPETYDVTSIADGVFQSLTSPARVVLPKKLTHIGENAFKDTPIKGELVIPETVTTIGKCAFQNCDKLTGKIVIPNSISDDGGIGESAFEGCTNITSLAFNFDSSSERELKLGIKAFSGCTRLSQIDLTSWGSGDDAKMSLSWDIPKEEEEKKEQNPFGNISKTGHILTPYGSGGITVYDPRYEMFIENFCFDDYGLKQEYRKRSSSYEEINDSAPWLFGVYWPKGSSEREELKDTDFAIKNLSHLAGLKPRITSFIPQIDTINIPGVVTDIDDSAFRNTFTKKDFINSQSTKSKYWYLTFNNNLLNIGNYAFADSTGLSGELTLPMSLRSIGDYAFSQCYQFRGSFALPAQLEHIGDAAFFNCFGLSASDLIFPDSLEYVGANAFYGISTPEVTINSGIKELSDCAFMGIKNLETIDLTNFADIPSNEEWSDLAFFMTEPTEKGTVLVKKGSDTTRWEQFLSAHGLDLTNWTVEPLQ